MCSKCSECCQARHSGDTSPTPDTNSESSGNFK